MVIQYLIKDREKDFPHIKDFSKDQDHIKLQHPNDLDYKTWFWFHHTAHNWFSFGVDIIGLIMFIPILIVTLNYLPILVSIIPLIFILVFMYSLKKKIKNHKITKNLSFYDLMIRDYAVDEKLAKDYDVDFEKVKSKYE